MARVTLQLLRKRTPGEKLFECTREDFFLWLYVLDITLLDVETDGHKLYVIYLRNEVDEAIQWMLDPTRPLMCDYRKMITAREVWRSLLQLLADYKATNR
jgi:hypothetical protein